MHFTLSEPHPDMTFFQWSEADRPLVRSYLVGETSELMLWYAQLTGKPWLRGPFPCTPNIVDIERTYEEAFSQWRRLVSRGREQRSRSAPPLHGPILEKKTLVSRETTE